MFSIVAVAFFFILFAIWSKDGMLNLGIKVAFLCMALWGLMDHFKAVHP